MSDFEEKLERFTDELCHERSANGEVWNIPRWVLDRFAATEENDDETQDTNPKETMNVFGEDE